MTLDIVGIPHETHGGLQILEFGKAYLNFGYAGVIGIGVLFGFLLREPNAILAWAKTQQSTILLACVYAFLLLVGQFYVSGSTMLTDASLALLTLTAIYWFSLTRNAAAYP